jgi:hypothetical protein
VWCRCHSHLRISLQVAARLRLEAFGRAPVAYLQDRSAIRRRSRGPGRPAADVPVYVGGPRADQRLFTSISVGLWDGHAGCRGAAGEETDRQRRVPASKCAGNSPGSRSHVVQEIIGTANRAVIRRKCFVCPCKNSITVRTFSDPVSSPQDRCGRVAWPSCARAHRISDSAVSHARSAGTQST